MAPTTKKSSRSISFTQAEADQALLETIDHELAEQRYSSFSELCKEALRQLLANQSEQPPLQLVALQQQLTRLEEALATKELPQWERFEDQLADLTKQLEQVVSQSNQPLIDLQNQITRLEQTLSAKEVSQFSEFERLLTRLGFLFEQLEAKSSPPSEPEPTEVLSETAHEPDPVLSRLSRMLESF